MKNLTSLMSVFRVSAGLIAFLFLVAGSNAQNLDVAYVPTPDFVVERMLDMADIGPGDYVIDLGCGDGRIVIAAAKRGATGLGVDIDEKLIKKARENAREAGVSDKVMFLKQDLFKTDISGASVITLYLFPDLINKLRPEFTEQLEPGARIVSHDFDMNDWKPDKHAAIKSNKILSDTLVPLSEDERETYSLLHKKLNPQKPLSLLSHDIF